MEVREVLRAAVLLRVGRIVGRGFDGLARREGGQVVLGVAGLEVAHPTRARMASDRRDFEEAL